MSKIAPTLRGAGITPVCPRCGTNENVRRMWTGGKKHWYCDACFKVTSTKRQEPTLKQRIFHRLPEPETMRLSEVFTNRAQRRRKK